MDGLKCSCGKPAVYYAKFKIRNGLAWNEWGKRYLNNDHYEEIEIFSCQEHLNENSKRIEKLIKSMFTCIHKAEKGPMQYISSDYKTIG
jgi:hypothetical protein